MKNKAALFSLLILVALILGFLFMRNRQSAFMKCYKSSGWVELGDTSQPTCGGHVATQADVKEIYSQ